MRKMRVRKKSLSRKSQLHAEEREDPKKRESKQEELFWKKRECRQNISTGGSGKSWFDMYLANSEVGKQDRRLKPCL